MYPLTMLKIKYIGYRIDGLSRGRAYQKASGNPSLKSCYNLGSRLEKKDPRILQLILEGLAEKQKIIKQERNETFKRKMAEANRIADLDRADKEVIKQAERLLPRTRKNRVLPPNAYSAENHRSPRKAVTANTGWDALND